MPTVYSGMGGSQGYGENSYVTNGPSYGNVDDGAVLVNVTSVFGASGLNFFGTEYTSIFINSNGTLTFESEELSYIPSGITVQDAPMIAPFFGDVDVSKGGDIFWDLDPAAETFTVTWSDVAPFTGSGVNTFQVRLSTNGSGGFELEYIYEDIQWSEGYNDAPTTAGYTDGDANVLELAGSGDPVAVLDYEITDFGISKPDGIYNTFFSSTGQPICFVSGTYIETPSGRRLVESLIPGDLVLTLDQGLSPLIWCARVPIRRVRGRVIEEDLSVLIPPEALGPGLPRRALRLSAQHRVLAKGAMVEQLFGTLEILVPAKGLVGAFGVDWDDPGPKAGFHHLLLERHGILRAEGAWAESLFLGPLAQSNMKVPTSPTISHATGAREFATVGQTRKLATRLQRTGKRLFSHDDM